MAIFPGAVATDSDLYVAVNQRSTTLTDNPLTNVATTVNVTSTTGFPAVGFISIDSEIIKYTGTTATSFTGCTRGADSTTAASHGINSTVYHNVVAAHHNANKEEIKATQQFISDLIGRSTSQIKAPDGSASVPSFAFASETNSGWYRNAANQIAIAVAGVSKARWTTAGLNIDSGSFFVNTSGGVIQNQNGSAAAPSYSFVNDSDTGWFGLADNSMRLSLGGTQRYILDSGQFYTPNGSVGLPAWTFSSDSDTGIYLAGANDLGLVAAGTLIMEVTGTKVISSQPVLFPDGSVSVPSVSFGSDQDTGFYRFGSGLTSYTANGIEAIRFMSSTSSDNAIGQLLRFNYGTSGVFSFSGQKTTSVTTTPKLIGGVSFGLVMVYGNDGSNFFFDFLLSTYNSGAPIVIAQKTHAGSPATRTYSNDGVGLLLAMGSGTYTVAAAQLDMGF